MQDPRPETRRERGPAEAGGGAPGGEPPRASAGCGKGRAAAGAAGAAGEPGAGDSCVEHNSSWGDFEGFSGASDQPDPFSTPDLAERGAAPGTRHSPDSGGCAPGARGRLQPQSLPGGKEAAAAAPAAANLSYENIFKLVFQEVPVQQMTEDICTLHHFLEKHNEENSSCKPIKKQFCSESQKLWRILQDEDGTSTSKCLWSKSHCQDNFLLVLGIDTAQKDFSGGKNQILEDSNLKETEELTEVNGFNLNNCKALIQTKLSGSSAPRHSNLFMYNLFLKKTPSSGNMQYITIPRKKKLFTARNLKMKFFNSDVC